MSSLCSSNNKALSIAASVVINPSIVPMFGWIIPEPLHIPAIVTVFPLTSTSTAASFGFVSVVRIAQDASSSLCLSAFNSGTNFLIPSLITSIGSCCPITPVEPTTTSSGLISNNFATSFASVTTFSYPCAPVHAFAIPVLITTALTASCSSTIFFPHKTGAAFTMFFVNVPAIFAGTSLTIIAMSLFVFPGFTPARSPAHLKPFGAVTPALMIFIILVLPYQSPMGTLVLILILQFLLIQT